MKKLMLLCAVAGLTGCVSPKIPDDVPPPPPARKDVVKAPSADGEADESVDEGFGGGGFGGETPTVEVDAAPAEPVAEDESADEDETEEGVEAKDGDKADEAKAEDDAESEGSAKDSKKDAKKAPN